MKKNKIVIIGATSAIAKECARLWTEETPSQLILVGRNQKKLDMIAADLRVRSPETIIKTIDANFYDPREIQTLANEICAGAGVDIVLIAHGTLPHQKECQEDLTQCRHALELNGLSPVLFAEAFVSNMIRVDKGTLAIIGSVAGDRGRKSNYAYGAAKSLVDCYVQGLQHRLAPTNVKIVIIKPGPTDTPMTAHLELAKNKLASVEGVANDIVTGINLGKTVVYTPKKWAFIMLVVRNIPNFIFNKLEI